MDKLFRGIGILAVWLGLTGLLGGAALLQWTAALEPDVPPAVASPAPPPVMAGVRLTGWQDLQPWCSLEVARLELQPKRWGPFKLDHSHDVVLQDCRLTLTHDLAAAGLRQMGGALLQMAAPKPPPGLQTEGESDEGQSLGLLRMPPKILAQPFAGTLTFADGRRLTISAAQAVNHPPLMRLELCGQVLVSSPGGVSLRSDEASWDLENQELHIGGTYRLTSSKGRFRGSDACFSLAQGKIRPLGKRKVPLTPPEPEGLPFSPQLLISSALGKKPGALGQGMTPLAFLMPGVASGFSPASPQELFPQVTATGK